MELLQDGVVAALAAIGVTALIWLAASLLLWHERPVDAVYLVRVSGDPDQIHRVHRALMPQQQRRRQPYQRRDADGRQRGDHAVL